MLVRLLLLDKEESIMSGSMLCMQFRKQNRNMKEIPTSTRSSRDYTVTNPKAEFNTRAEIRNEERITNRFKPEQLALVAEELLSTRLFKKEEVLSWQFLDRKKKT